jgi:hypothetical protein
MTQIMMVVAATIQQQHNQMSRATKLIAVRCKKEKKKKEKKRRLRCTFSVYVCCAQKNGLPRSAGSTMPLVRLLRSSASVSCEAEVALCSVVFLGD